MNYIIDGHNLISQFPGLSLNMPDDEQRLVELLIIFCRDSNHRVEVYFDQAQVGRAGMRGHGRVQALFVSSHFSADDAIRKRLGSLGRSARSWTVVSSDRAVQAAAREVHSQVLSAVDFSLLLHTRLPAASSEPSNTAPDKPLSEAEVREWETIFNQGRKPK